MSAELVWRDDTYAADQKRFEQQQEGLAAAREAGARIRAANWQEVEASYGTRDHMPFPHHRTCAQWGPA